MSVRNYSSTAADATLSGSVNAAATTLVVSATTGFPAVPFILAVDAGSAAQELVLVTNVAGTSLTVTRGYDSTVAVSHDTGAVVAHSHGAIDFREANAHVNASSGVHGRTGAVVGTTDTQTLTNKTLALGSNTVSGTKAQFNAALTDGDFATQDGAETLTNKDLSSSTNTFPASLPKGVLGYAQVTSNQGGLTGTASDLTGLSVAVTVAAGRRVRISCHVRYNATSAGTVDVLIAEGATVLGDATSDYKSTANQQTIDTSVIIAPSAGAHTYKLQGAVASSGNLVAAATRPCFILVEDIGAA